MQTGLDLIPVWSWRCVLESRRLGGCLRKVGLGCVARPGSPATPDGITALVSAKYPGYKPTLQLVGGALLPPASGATGGAGHRGHLRHLAHRCAPWDDVRLGFSSRLAAVVETYHVTFSTFLASRPGTTDVGACPGELAPTSTWPQAR